MIRDPRLAGCNSIVDPQKLCLRKSSVSGDIHSFRGFKIGALTAKIGAAKVGYLGDRKTSHAFNFEGVFGGPVAA